VVISQESGTVHFQNDKDIAFKSKWPLPPGSYVAAMMRNGDEHNPWRELAVSAPFQIRRPSFGQTAVRLVRQDVKLIINDDIKWAAKFLRLAFHDSVGAPDGCVSLLVKKNYFLRLLFLSSLTSF
jgi:Peroxidase